MLELKKKWNNWKSSSNAVRAVAPERRSGGIEAARAMVARSSQSPYVHRSSVYQRRPEVRSGTGAPVAGRVMVR